MIPIFEQGKGRGIGLSTEHFQQRFVEICQTHVKDKRAVAFAFILYDFVDDNIRSILKHEGIFTQLDRLAGRDLSVFYIHSRTRRTIEDFNSKFLAKIGVQQDVTLPCVLFFRLDGGGFKDIEIAQLDHTDLLTAFHELYTVIEKYISESQTNKPSKAMRFVKGSLKFVGSQSFGAALGAWIGDLF